AVPPGSGHPAPAPTAVRPAARVEPDLAGPPADLARGDSRDRAGGDHLGRDRGLRGVRSPPASTGTAGTGAPGAPGEPPGAGGAPVGTAGDHSDQLAGTSTFGGQQLISR